MCRLVVNPGTPQAWELQLKPGINSLGRDEGNDFQIEHPSVSARHCEITVGNSGVALKDCGSTNGTFLADTLVEDAVLKPGQIFRMGDVVLRLESTHAPPKAAVVSPVPRADATAVEGPINCRFHPRTPARYSCPSCGKRYCESCVSTRSTPSGPRRMCRTCSVECVALENRPEPPAQAETFAQSIRGAFGYPLKGDGVVLLVTGGILLLLVDGAKFIVRYGFVYGLAALIILNIFGTGYLTAYLRRILTSSAMGEQTMPDWPEVEGFGDFASPFFQLLVTVLFCFAPMLVLTIAAPADSPWLGWATTAALLLGCIYFPMAFMSVAMFDSVRALSPLLVIPTILKIPGEYMLAILMFILILVVRWLGESVLPRLLGIPILPAVFASFVGLYLLTVEVRILGLLYRANRDEFGWFNH